MEKEKIGILGCGMMGKAIIRGLLKSDGNSRYKVFCYDKIEQAANDAEKCGAQICPNIFKLCEESDSIIICVKPDDLDELMVRFKKLKIFKDRKFKKKIFISVVAGGHSSAFYFYAENWTKFVRAMPNTPALIGKGMTAIATSMLNETKNLSINNEFHDLIDGKEKKIIKLETHEIEKVMRIFSTFGEVVRIKEEQMDAATGLSGSGPAYAFTFIEALAAGGVLQGLDFENAKKMAAQTLAGAAQMCLQSDKHPAQLLAQVCSPGGTTIAGIAELEKRGFRNACINAVKKASQKSQKMLE